jgi:basic membrane protein A and related proteins
MAEAAKTHIAAGADVLTGSSQAVVGSIGAAKEKGKVLWFGTQQNQTPIAPELVVASQQYDWTGILKQMINDRKGGKLGGEKFVLRLNNGGLKIVYNSSYKLPAAAKAAGDKAIQGISNGSIKVTP